jgi:hypothetical protein
MQSKNFKLKFNNIFDEPVSEELLKQFENRKGEQDRMIRIEMKENHIQVD